MHRFHMIVDGKEYRFSASEVMITNTKLLGLDVQLEGANIDGNDGRLDLFIVRARNTAEFMKVLSNFVVARSANGDDTLHYIHVKDHVSIESEFPLPVQADGEEIGVTPVDMRLIPGALQVVIPVAEDK
jgi:diacylglycerol kinase family enzyme